MRNFEETFKTPRRSFISAFSICMTVPSKSSNQKVGRVAKKLGRMFELQHNIRKFRQNPDELSSDFVIHNIRQKLHS